MKKYFILLLVLLLISPAYAVNLTYPYEYYSYKSITEKEPTGSIWQNVIINYAEKIFNEQRRQTILMEKQNELLYESNYLTWIDTCYNMFYDNGYNFSVIKDNCNREVYDKEVS